MEKETRLERWTTCTCSWAEVRGALAAQDRVSWQKKATALCTSWRGAN